MSKRRSRIAATAECRHCAPEKSKRNREPRLNPICPCVFPLSYRERPEKIDGPRIDFLPSVFRQTLSASPPPSAPSFFLPLAISLFSSLVPRLHSTRLHFCSPTLFLSPPLSFRLGVCDYSPPGSVYQNGRGEKKKALSDPLCFHFPRFLRGTDSIAACC